MITRKYAAMEIIVLRHVWILRDIALIIIVFVVYRIAEDVYIRQVQQVHYGLKEIV